MVLTEEKRSAGSETRPNATLSIIWTAVGSSLGLHVERLATVGLGHGSTCQSRPYAFK